MANRHVREIGTVRTRAGAIVRVGVDHELVTAVVPPDGGEFTIAQAAVFMRLWLEAVGVAEKYAQSQALAAGASQA